MTETKSIFISGNLDLPEKQFIQYYMPIITELAKDENTYFNISDDEGCAEMTQILLNKILTNRNNVNVFCIGQMPKHYISENFMCFSGFKTLEERDAAMTFASNIDLHIVLEGKGSSAVKNNICRRQSPEYNYMKHYMSNFGFWQMFFNNDIPESNLEEVEQDTLNNE